MDAARGDLEGSPLAHATLLRAWRQLDHPQPQVVLAGPSEPVADWHRQLAVRDDCHAYRLPPGSATEDLPDLLQPMADADRAVAMVCLGQRCLAPAHTFEELSAQLSQARG